MQIRRRQRLGRHVHKVSRPISLLPSPTHSLTPPSRSGEPKWSNVTASPSPPSWAHKVTWERADIFQPTTYAPLLTNADYVVHSMGILLEADYKGVLTGQESPLSGLRKAFSDDKGRNNPNPLEQGDNDTYKTPESEKQLTYENMNRDSAVLLARAANEAGSEAFLYVSAAGGAPRAAAPVHRHQARGRELDRERVPAHAGRVCAGAIFV